MRDPKRSKPRGPMAPEVIASRANRPTVTSRKRIVKLRLSGEKLDSALRVKTLMDARTLVDVPLTGIRLLDYVLSRMQLGWRFQMRNDDLGETVEVSLLPLLYGKADKPLVYSRTTHEKAILDED